MLAEANNSNIKRLASLYGMFQNRNNWRGPEDEQDLKQFLTSSSARKLRAIGVEPDSIDAIFINERDGEPFKVRYGVPGHPLGTDAPVVFEATGVDGMRMVGRLNMTQEEVDAAEYDRLWSGDGDPGPGATR